MDDMEILSWGVKENRVIVTMDKDFGELVYRSKEKHKGVLLLRLEDKTGKEKAEIVAKIAKKYGTRLAGRFAVYRAARLRFRK